MNTIEQRTQHSADERFFLHLNNAETLLQSISQHLEKLRSESKTKEINWSHVGDIAHISEFLENVTECIG